MITLTKYGNFIDDLLNENRETLSGFFNASAKTGKVNIAENATGHRLEFLLPGYKKENVNIDVDATLLTITATLPAKEPVEGETYTVKEFDLPALTRQFQLPKKADTSAIVATFEDGILTVTIPNLTDSQTNRLSIAIK